MSFPRGVRKTDDCSEKSPEHQTKSTKPTRVLSALLFLCNPLLPGVLFLPPGITVLLSLTVFMLMVAEIMPATSDSVPLIGQCFSMYLFVGFCGGADIVHQSIQIICTVMSEMCSPPGCLRAVLCQHHGDCRDVGRGHSHRPAVPSSQPQQWTHATMGEF